VEPGQPHVQYHQIGPYRPGRGDRARTVMREVDGEPFGPQPDGDRLRDRPLVLDHQHPLHSAHSIDPAWRRTGRVVNNPWRISGSGLRVGSPGRPGCPRPRRPVASSGMGRSAVAGAVAASVLAAVALTGCGPFNTFSDEHTDEVAVTEVNLNGGAGSVTVSPGAERSVRVKRTVRYSGD